MSKYVERFSVRERVLHWLVTVCFFTLLLTGLGLFSRLFHGYFTLFGGGQNAILIHKICGVIFFAGSLGMFLHYVKDVAKFDEDDMRWFRESGGYLSKSAGHFDIGKFNPGQKLFAIFIAAATLALGVTGVFIWSPTSFPRWIVQFSLLMHGLMFVGAIMFVIVHVYLATIGNPGTLQAMLYGHVGRRWAKNHHPKWYGEVTGEKP